MDETSRQPRPDAQPQAPRARHCPPALPQLRQVGETPAPRVHDEDAGRGASGQRAGEHGAFSALLDAGCVRDSYVLDLQERIGAYADRVVSRPSRGVWCLAAVDRDGVLLATAAADELAVALRDLLEELEGAALAALRPAGVPREAHQARCTVPARPAL